MMLFAIALAGQVVVETSFGHVCYDFGKWVGTMRQRQIMAHQLKEQFPDLHFHNTKVDADSMRNALHTAAACGTLSDPAFLNLLSDAKENGKP